MQSCKNFEMYSEAFKMCIVQLFKESMHSEAWHVQNYLESDVFLKNNQAWREAGNKPTRQAALSHPLIRRSLPDHLVFPRMSS